MVLNLDPVKTVGPNFGRSEFGLDILCTHNCGPIILRMCFAVRMRGLEKVDSNSTFANNGCTFAMVKKLGTIF